MTIRAVAAEDLPAVAKLLRELSPDLTAEDLAARLKAVAERPDHRIWIFKRNATIIGVMHAFVRPALEKPVEVVVQALVIDPAHRKAGIGRNLMAEVERWAKELGHASVALHTQNAAPFYEGIGYAKIATPHFMRKTLT